MLKFFTNTYLWNVGKLPISQRLLLHFINNCVSFKQEVNTFKTIRIISSDLNRCFNWTLFLSKSQLIIFSVPIICNHTQTKHCALTNYFQNGKNSRVQLKHLYKCEEIILMVSNVSASCLKEAHLLINGYFYGNSPWESSIV